MSGVNKVILVGRLGKDPEVRHTDAGHVVATASIATSETYKDRTTGEKKEQTEWHRLIFWNKLAEVVEQYLNKGDMIYVEGPLRTRSWEKDGITRYVTEVVVKQLTMLSTKNNNGVPAPEPTDKDRQDMEYQEGDDDDLPF